MRTKLLLRLATVFVLAFLSLCAVAGYFLSERTLHPGRRVLSSGDELSAEMMALRHGYRLENVDVVARDGETLRAWAIRRQGNSSSVVLLHGLGDNRAGMIGYAELLMSRGFDVLLPDARAHGTSGGDLATYGLLESDDIHRWVDWLEQEDHPDCVFGFAESMGAAQLLQSLKTENRFSAVAVESSFANFREIAYDRVGQYFGTGPWLGRTILRPVVFFAFAYARWEENLDFRQLSPEDAVAQTNVPVLLIHGQSDKNISVRHARLIVGRNPSVYLWEVPNADHGGAVGVAPEEFRQKLFRWFDSHAHTKKTLALARN